MGWIRESIKYYNGQVLENYTILELNCEVRHPRRFFTKVKCNSCNKEKNILTFTIKHNKTCGCKRYKNKKYSKKKLFSGYMAGAKTRNLPFELTFQKFDEMTDDICFYCGSSSSIMINKECSNKTVKSNQCNGIDRIDNNLGYITGNIVTCCKICNRGKNAMPFIEWNLYLDYLAHYRNKK